MFGYLNPEPNRPDSDSTKHCSLCNLLARFMTSGRSHVVSYGDYGHIEFVHTAQSLEDVNRELTYDADRRPTARDRTAAAPAGQAPPSP